jgi:hypothetical protein
MARRLRRIPPGWWVIVLTLPALVPLAHAGFFESHDGLFHAYRLAALDRSVRAGVLYPRWFPEMAFGYGQPLLNFYGPLSYYLGLPFTLLGLSAAHALKLVFAGGLLLSALGMLRFARLHLERWPSVVAAAVYVLLPYHLADLYVRGAVAEFLAFAWLPLTLWAFHRLIEEETGSLMVRVGQAATITAALLLTHTLSALVFSPVLAGSVLLLLIRRRERRAVGLVALALGLALAVSAFYWLPVLVESRYVGLGHGASLGYRDHLVPLSDLVSISATYRYPTGSGVVPAFPLGLAQVVILVLALVLPTRPGRERWVTVFYLGVAYVSAFMLTSLSLPIWQALERVLALLQYPWRFQVLTALATAFLAGALVQSLAPRKIGQDVQDSQELPFLGRFAASRKCCLFVKSWRRSAVVLLLLVLTGAWALWRMPLTPVTPDFSSAAWTEAMWRGDQEEGQVGTTWTGEYVPIWVSEQRWALSLPAIEPAYDGRTLPDGTMRLTGVGSGRYDLDVNAPQGVVVALHQFYYPGWSAVNRTTGSRIPARPAGALGLAAFDLPPMAGRVTLRLGWTAAQWWGTLISATSVAGVAFLALVVAFIGRRRLHRDRDRRGALWLASAALLGACVLLVGLARPHGRVQEVTPVNAVLAEPGSDAPSLELLSFSLGAPTGSHRAGDVVSVTLYWHALRNLGQDYKAFVHLTDAALTRQPAQHDGDPGGGFTPATRWLVGELVPDTHHLALPSDLRPGQYLLWAGMYEYETVQNLTVASSEAPASDSRVLLGEIEVLAR